MRLLLIAPLVLCLGSLTSWAGQQSSKSSPPSAQAAPTSGQKRARVTPAKSATPPAQQKGTTESSSTSELSAGKRDPFKLPETGGGKATAEGFMESLPEGGVLPPGTRGLLISQLKLEGVVREQVQNKMIAVVTNETKRAYFLTENESVYNGVVSKITPDAVYFKENVLDSSGRVTTREVVKRLGSAPGEGR